MMVHLLVGVVIKPTHNTGLAKVAVQCSAETFVVNQNRFSASTFVAKIATFAKPENVMPNRKQQKNKTK
jgi:hypothetical protein